MTSCQAERLLLPAWELFSLPFFVWNCRISADFFASIQLLQKTALRLRPGHLFRRIRYFRFFAHGACILYNKSTTLNDCFPLTTTLQGFTAEILKLVDSSIYSPDQLPASSIKEFRCTAAFPVVFSWNSGYWRDRTTDQGIKKRSFILDALRSGASVFLQETHWSLGEEKKVSSEIGAKVKSTEVPHGQRGGVAILIPHSSKWKEKSTHTLIIGYAIAVLATHEDGSRPVLFVSVYIDPNRLSEHVGALSQALIARGEFAVPIRQVSKRERRAREGPGAR